MTDPTDICVIIVTYNSEAYLPRCLAALSRQTLTQFDIIVFDNASEITPDSLGAPLVGVQWVRSATNIGFAAANNAAARLTTSPWLALLNPDAFPEPDWLAELVKARDRWPEVKLFGSTQINAENPERLDGVGDVAHASGLVWRGGFGAPAATTYSDAEIFSACGAAAFVERETFLALGGFDEGFFCFCEDVDLGYRLRRRGGRVVHAGGAVVAHVGGGSAGRRSAFATRLGARNRLWTFVKNAPGPLFWLMAPVHLIATVLVGLVATGRGLGGPYWSGVAEAIRAWPRVWAQRAAERRAAVADWRVLGAALNWSPLAPLRRSSDRRPLT
ncbi:MAG: glycosyltransferase family 2 protein [Maricaulaceae bacterium]